MYINETTTAIYVNSDCTYTIVLRNKMMKATVMQIVLWSILRCKMSICCDTLDDEKDYNSLVNVKYENCAYGNTGKVEELYIQDDVIVVECELLESSV